jgi:hypothetical protein
MSSDWLPPNATPPSAPLPLPVFLELLSGHLQSAAVDLRPQQVAEVGFLCNHAIEAVKELAALNLAILGGDVWQAAQGSAPQLTYDNWHVDRGLHESWDAYVRRAAAHSRDRIAFFDSTQPDGATLFVLVPSTELHHEELKDRFGRMPEPEVLKRDG